MEQSAKRYVIGIDLGGTKITTALADRQGRIVEKTTLATGAKEGEEVVMGRIIESVDMVLEASGLSKDAVAVIGIGSPGPIDSDKGAIITTPNLPFKNYSLTQPLEKRYGIPAYLDNDGNVAAIGEWMFGAGKGYDHVIYMTVSTGVGGGAVLNGKPFHGRSSNALEIGHMTIRPDAPYFCNCGNQGDVESLCSGTAMTKRAQEAIAQGRETSLKDLPVVTAYEINQARLAGDGLAKEILEEAWDNLGIAVANLILAFEPEVLAIGGGVSRIGQDMFDAVIASAHKRCFDFMVDGVKIVPTGLSQDTGVLGAVALAVVKAEEQ